MSINIASCVPFTIRCSGEVGYRSPCDFCGKTEYVDGRPVHLYHEPKKYEHDLVASGFMCLDCIYKVTKDFGMAVWQPDLMHTEAPSSIAEPKAEPEPEVLLIDDSTMEREV